MPVLEQTQADLINFQGSGMSVMEMSHRGPEFTRIIEEAEADLRKLMAIPDNYKVLFLQGGASQQFSAIPFNLTQPDDVVDHVRGPTHLLCSSEDRTLHVTAAKLGTRQRKSHTQASPCMQCTLVSRLRRSPLYEISLPPDVPALLRRDSCSLICVLSDELPSYIGGDRVMEQEGS